jgi:hypothetical protein
LSFLHKAGLGTWIGASLVVFALANLAFGLRPEGPMPWDSEWVRLRYLLYDSAPGYLLSVVMFLAVVVAFFRWARG